MTVIDMTAALTAAIASPSRSAAGISRPRERERGGIDLASATSDNAGAPLRPARGWKGSRQRLARFRRGMGECPLARAAGSISARKARSDQARKRSWPPMAVTIPFAWRAARATSPLRQLPHAPLMRLAAGFA
ncbi:hypothetical protein [Sphingomonas oryzagri]